MRARGKSKRWVDGLELGVTSTFRTADEEGERKRPDALVYLPGNRAVVVGKVLTHGVR